MCVRVCVCVCGCVQLGSLEGVVLLYEGGPLPGPKTGLLTNTWK